jgi:DNA-binding Lrp family transcriptional regulator
MTKFEFTRSEFEVIKEKCMFNEELSKILEYRIKNYSITEIALNLNLSESTVSRRIKEIKNKIVKVI